MRQEDRPGNSVARELGETESVFYLNGPSFIGVLDRNKIELNTLWVRLKILN